MATINDVHSWFAGAVGRGMDPDGMYGYQCKDVADDYCLHLWGDWTNTVRPGNANVVFENSNPDYFEKTSNNMSDPNQLPKYGDLICWDGWPGNPYGHIAVCKSADVNGIVVIQQNGFRDWEPASEVWWSWNTHYVTGWLSPKLDPVAPPEPPVPPPVVPPVVVPPTPEPPVVTPPVTPVDPCADIVTELNAKLTLKQKELDDMTDANLRAMQIKDKEIDRLNKELAACGQTETLSGWSLIALGIKKLIERK